MATDSAVDRLTSGWDGRHLSLFVLGVVLILLGLAGGLDLPVVKSVSSTGPARAVSVALGVLAVAVAFVRSDGPAATATATATGTATATADQRPDLARVLARLSFGQQRLLDIVRAEALATGVVSQDALERAVKSMGWSGGELYYRLETLVLLGFLEKRPAGQNAQGTVRFTYARTDAARRVMDDPS